MTNDSLKDKGTTITFTAEGNFSLLEVARNVKKAFEQTKVEIPTELNLFKTDDDRKFLREETAHFIPLSEYKPESKISGFYRTNKLGVIIEAGIDLTYDDTGIPPSVIEKSALAPLNDKRFPQILSGIDKYTAKKAKRKK